MAAAKKRKHSPTAANALMMNWSSSESDSDDWSASESRTMRPKDDDKILPYGFLDPLMPFKSNKFPEISGNENAKWRKNDESYVKRQFLLKLLQDHNKPKWRKNDVYVKGTWDKICQAYNERFLDVNRTKTHLRRRVYQMKRTYKVLKQLSELRGLKWDHSKNMLQGTQDVWKKIMHTNKDAKTWYNRPWPYYSTCQELFTGKSVNETQSSGTDESGERVTAQAVKLSQKNMDSPQTSIFPLHSTMKAQKKMPSQELSGTEFENMKGKNDQCCETTRLAHDETSFSIKTCIEGFYKLSGFTRADLFKVGRIFKSIENREIFLSLTEEDREFWLMAEIDADYL